MSSALCLFPQFHLVELRKINLRRSDGENLSYFNQNAQSSHSCFPFFDVNFNTHFAFICNQSLSLVGMVKTRSTQRSIDLLRDILPFFFLCRFFASSSSFSAIINSDINKISLRIICRQTINRCSLPEIFYAT